MPGRKVVVIVVTTRPLLIYHVKSDKASGLLTTECGEPSREIVLDVAENEQQTRLQPGQRQNRWECATTASQRITRFLVNDACNELNNISVICVMPTLK